MTESEYKTVVKLMIEKLERCKDEIAEKDAEIERLKQSVTASSILEERDEIAKILSDNFTPEKYDPSDFEWCACQLQLAGYHKVREMVGGNNDGYCNRLGQPCKRNGW